MVRASNPDIDSMNRWVADMLAELAAREPDLVARVAVLPPRAPGDPFGLDEWARHSFPHIGLSHSPSSAR